MGANLRRKKNKRILARYTKAMRAENFPEALRLAELYLRFDDDDSGWITIHGTHTLLENGVAVSGGKLAGMTFSKAVSTGSKAGKSKAKSFTELRDRAEKEKTEADNRGKELMAQRAELKSQQAELDPNSKEYKTLEKQMDKIVKESQKLTMEAGKLSREIGFYNKLEASGIEYKEAEELSQPLTSEEIIRKISGFDKTSGSCVSVALAYIGNDAGYDVLDFRGGDSVDFFQLTDNIEYLADLKDVNSKQIETRTPLDDAMKLARSMPYDKEQLLSVGTHSAIVKKEKGAGLQYLELQSDVYNGWRKLDQNALSTRFEVRKNSGTSKTLTMIDAESLGKSEGFRTVLGYINTSENNQKKK